MALVKVVAGKIPSKPAPIGKIRHETLGVSHAAKGQYGDENQFKFQKISP